MSESNDSRRIGVSVIIPCYNQGKYIEETIQSVLASTYTDLEIIVINDGSSDSLTNNLLKTKEWPKTRIYHTLNQGVSASRNFGIKKSSGKYILPLDADDKIDRTYIEKAIKIFENSSDVLLVYSRAIFFGRKNKKWLLPEFSMEIMLCQNVIYCSAIFRRSDFDKTGGYNSNMKGGFEDWDFWLSLLEIEGGGNVIRIDEPLFFYRIKARSRNTGINSAMYSKLRKTIYENHKKLYCGTFFNPVYSFEYSNLLRSYEYRIGSLILWPFKQILKFF